MPTKTAAKKVTAAKQELTVHLPDTRGVTLSRWGRGNIKLGMDGVYTYSRLPGRPDGEFEALAQEKGFDPGTSTGTCPGSSIECESICYAKRVVNTPLVWEMWKVNSWDERLPLPEYDPLPEDAKIVRIHVSGDFSSVEYIEEWIKLAESRPNVDFFSYTRSWRVPELLGPLERFRALSNVQLFASMDKSIEELPPQGWRRAWIEDDPRCNLGDVDMQEVANTETETVGVDDVGRGYVCPEEMGRQPDCQTCGYCIRGRKHDVVFLLH